MPILGAIVSLFHLQPVDESGVVCGDDAVLQIAQDRVTLAIARVAEATTAGGLDDESVVLLERKVGLGRHGQQFPGALDQEARRLCWLTAEQAPGSDAVAVG